MVKIIWTLWLQGWSESPPLVRKCLSSWQEQNPSWEVRALDLTSLRLLLELPSFSGRSITSASFSDFVRIALLYEFGGVWVDSTLLCRRPLDHWLPSVMEEGFFAFERYDRPIASWFLASEAGHPLTGKWLAATDEYWQKNSSADSYFWFHELFEKLCKADVDFCALWERVPKISADGPHLPYRLGLGSEDAEAFSQLTNEASPVFKLSYRHDPALLGRSCLLNWLLQHLPDPVLPQERISFSRNEAENELAGLTVHTNNLGDHIQILSARSLTQRLWKGPTISVDRDHGIASLPGLSPQGYRLPVVLNGWFKYDHAQWPPHPRLLPAYVGFHIRLSKCPPLVEPAALEHYRQYGPIGCRDLWTYELLRGHGIDAYISHCLSLIWPRRLPALTVPKETFVVSRDTRLLQFLPASIGPYTFISHYSDSYDFQSNLLDAARLLCLYRDRARLIVTTLLHCALPAMAMGIPVVMVSPENSPAGMESDRQRFSSLKSMLPIYSIHDLSCVDWNPPPADCVEQKLAAFDGFARSTQRWHLPVVPLSWEFAPSASLPPPR